MNPTRIITVAVLAAVAVAACGSSDDQPTSQPTSSTTTAADPKFALTFEDWDGASRTDEELQFEEITSLVFGIATNPDKMLEYGYDFCELYAESDGSRADVIRDWAVEENQPLARASQLGAAATDYLCPE